jgi:hypothetical protein
MRQVTLTVLNQAGLSCRTTIALWIDPRQHEKNLRTHQGHPIPITSYDIFRNRECELSPCWRWGHVRSEKERDLAAAAAMSR